MSAARWRARRDWGVTLAALLALALWDISGWDLPLARAFADAAGFAARDAWWARTLLHDGGRWLAGVALAWLAVDALRAHRRPPTRAQRAYWLGVAVAALLLVPALKRASATSCPWDLAEFGGSAAYVPHWLPGLLDGGPGHCFPSGHATAAFAFLAMHFLWRDHHPQVARAWLFAVGVAGALFGAAQLARGAHYASHTLWSAWLCWTLGVLAARWSPGRTVVPDTPVGAAADQVV